jgi:disulfide oxidoreductase YuzD
MTNTEDSKKQWKTSSGMRDYEKEDFTNHRSKYTYIDMVSKKHENRNSELSEQSRGESKDKLA